MPQPDRLCVLCGKAIPNDARRGARFCKASCRINHHIKTHPPQPVSPDKLGDVRLNPVECGLLIDAAVPWHPTLGDPPATDQGTRMLVRFVANTFSDKPLQIPRPEAERTVDHARKAARRLVALGLVRTGMLGRRAVIERTELGTLLLARRHNELHAKAEHAGEAVPTKQPDEDHLAGLISAAYPSPRSQALTVHHIDWHRRDWVRERRKGRKSARETLGRLMDERMAAGYALEFGEEDTG